MQYKYITENNLEHPQNYMYTTYGGIDFLTAYFETRRPFLTENENNLTKLIFSATQSVSEEHSHTTNQLLEICQNFSDSSIRSNQDKIQWFIQRFEVRKRLFSEYDPQTGKPAGQSSYDNISNYMLLSAIAGRSYAVFGSLKYLNCFLKLNDTLLSLASKMTDQQILLLQALVTLEVPYVAELAKRKGIVCKGGALSCS